MESVLKRLSRKNPKFWPFQTGCCKGVSNPFHVGDGSKFEEKTKSADLGLKTRLSTNARFYEMASDVVLMGLDHLIGTWGTRLDSMKMFFD